MTSRAAIFLIVAFSSGALASWIPINCNKTFFIHGLSVCQKIALESLTRGKDITCDSVYKKQVSCLGSHVKKCLDGTQYAGLASAVVEFTKVITFNCGGVDGYANLLLFDALGCKAGTKQKFEMTTKCWDDFATKYKANKNDSTLCHSLADAKKCVSNMTNHYCSAVQLEPDSCNSFCANGTDDHRPCSAIPIYLTCQKDSYYKKERECEETFIGALTNKRPSSCSTEIPKLKSCIKNYYKENCFDPFVNESLLDKLSDSVLSVTKGQRLFCNAENVTDRPAALRDIISCGSGFYGEAENCSKVFREKYRQNKVGQTLCSTYENAKSCFQRVQERSCGFSPNLLRMTKDTYNPFCATRPDPSCGLSLYLHWSTLIISLMSFISHL